MTRTADNGVDEEALLQRYRPFVRRIALQIMARGAGTMELDDLLQAGMMGLLDAVRRYRRISEAQFETYAYQRVRGAIYDELRRYDWASRDLRKKSSAIAAAITRCEQRLGHRAGESDIAGELGIGLDEYRTRLQEARTADLLYIADLLNANVAADGRSAVEDIPDAEQHEPLAVLIERDRHALLARAVKALPERERLLMQLIYVEGLNVTETARVLGVTAGRVSQIKAQAVIRLQSYVKQPAELGADAQGEEVQP